MSLKLTLNELESLVRDRFNGFESDKKFPVLYGIYEADREAQHKRLIYYYKQYWDDSAADLKVFQDGLVEQEDTQRRQIYTHAGKALVLAKERFTKNKFEQFQDNILCWILAREKVSTDNKVAYGIGVIQPLNEDHTDNQLAKYLQSLNQFRFKWIGTYEKIKVVNDCIKAKKDKAELKYQPLDASGLHVLWDSEELKQRDENIREKRVERVEEIYREVEDYTDAIDQFNKEMGEVIYKNYASFKAARYKLRKQK